MLKTFFHANVCVRDLDRSLKFYQRLGFQVVQGPFELEGKDIGQMLGLEHVKLRAAFLRLGDAPGATMLDMLEFIDPVANSGPYPSLRSIGICRLCFKADDILRTYQELKDMGVEFVSPPVVKERPDGQRVTMFCFKDPDGTFLEIIDGV